MKILIKVIPVSLFLLLGLRSELIATSYAEEKSWRFQVGDMWFGYAKYHHGLLIHYGPDNLWVPDDAYFPIALCGALILTSSIFLIGWKVTSARHQLVHPEPTKLKTANKSGEGTA